MNERIAPGTLAAIPAARSHAAFTGENGEFRRLVIRGAVGARDLRLLPVCLPQATL